MDDGDAIDKKTKLIVAEAAKKMSKLEKGGHVAKDLDDADADITTILSNLKRSIQMAKQRKDVG